MLGKKPPRLHQIHHQQHWAIPATEILAAAGIRVAGSEEFSSPIYSVNVLAPAVGPGAVEPGAAGVRLHGEVARDIHSWLLLAWVHVLHVGDIAAGIMERF